MIENGNFASGQQADTNLSKDQNLIEQARKMAGDNQNDESPNNGGNNNNDENRGKRKIGIIIAVIVGIVALGIGGFFVFKLIGPKEEPAQQQEQTQQQEAAAPTTSKIDANGETLVVGKDLAAGPWYVERLSPSSKSWLEITRGKESWTLEQPNDTKLSDIWSNQVNIVALQEGDEITANGTLTQIATTGHPATSLAQIGDLRAGAYVVGVDLEPGTWDITAHAITDDLDLGKGTAIEGDLTWAGRVAGSAALVAAAEGANETKIQELCCGVIVLDYETATSMFGPMLGANLPFAEEAINGTGKTTDKEKTENKTDDKSKETTQTDTAAQQQQQPADAQQQAQQPTQTTAGAEQAKNAAKSMSDMAKADIKTLQQLLKRDTNSSNGFISADKKTVTLEEGQLVIPIMVDMSLHRESSAKSEKTDTKDKENDTPELKDEDSNKTNAEPSVFD